MDNKHQCFKKDMDGKILNQNQPNFNYLKIYRPRGTIPTRIIRTKLDGYHYLQGIDGQIGPIGRNWQNILNNSHLFFCTKCKKIIPATGLTCSIDECDSNSFKLIPNNRFKYLKLEKKGS